MPLSVQNVLNHLTNDKLSLNALKLKDEDMEAVVKVINQYRVLYVDLSHNDLTMMSMYQLGAALAKNQSVIFLDLSHNKINSDGATAIGSALQSNCVLQTLNMSHNPIQNLGASALVYPLSTTGPSALLRLDITNCHIGSEGITFFAKLLASNISLYHLKLAGNPIGKLEGIQLSYALLKNTKLRSLDLSHCRLIPVVGSLMLNILARSQSMESFEGHGNQLSDDALNELALRLSDNRDKRKQAECETVLDYYPEVMATTILGYMGDYKSALTYLRDLKTSSETLLPEGAVQQVGTPLTLDQDAKVKQKKVNL